MPHGEMVRSMLVSSVGSKRSGQKPLRRKDGPMNVVEDAFGANPGAIQVLQCEVLELIHLFRQLRRACQAAPPAVLRPEKGPTASSQFVFWVKGCNTRDSVQVASCCTTSAVLWQKVGALCQPLMTTLCDVRPPPHCTRQPGLRLGLEQKPVSARSSCKLDLFVLYLRTLGQVGSPSNALGLTTSLRNCTRSEWVRRA